jgi:hypothetical protein
MAEEKQTQRVEAKQVERQELAQNTSEAMGLARVMTDGDPEMMLDIIERKAKLASRFASAIMSILVTQTLPSDWTEFDKGKMGLSSAGAERVGRNFPIKIYNVSSRREDSVDAKGKYYRYIFEGYAIMGDREIFVTGAFSTREDLLGKKGGEWRPLDEINENDIRTAAYHIFMGNAIKSMLGLRDMTKEQIDKIYAANGVDSTRTNKVTHGSGTDGGTTQDDTKNQQELAKILIDLANALKVIEVDEAGKYSLFEVSEVSDAMNVAKGSCKALTSFYSKKDKKMITGIDSVKALKGQRLSIALENAKRLQGGGQ